MVTIAYGHMYTKTARGIAGTKAEPSCSHQPISPAFQTARLNAVPRKMPKAVQNCHVITRALKNCVSEYRDIMWLYLTRE
jgi:hypothetical protein